MSTNKTSQPGTQILATMLTNIHHKIEEQSCSDSQVCIIQVTSYSCVVFIPVHYSHLKKIIQLVKCHGYNASINLSLQPKQLNV